MFFSGSPTLSPQADRRIMEATCVHAAVHRHIYHLFTRTGDTFKPASSRTGDSVIAWVLVWVA